MRIEDGRGQNPHARTSPDGRVLTSSRSASRGFFASRDEESVFAWTSEVTGATSGAIVLSLTNTDPTRELEVAVARVGGANAGLFRVVQLTGAATGNPTPVVGSNLNLQSDKSAPATALGQGVIAGWTLGKVLGVQSFPAGGAGSELNFDGALIIGVNQTIGIQYVGATGDVRAAIRGIFEKPDA